MRDRPVCCRAATAAKCSFQRGEVGVTLLEEQVEVSPERSENMVGALPQGFVFEDLAAPSLSKTEEFCERGGELVARNLQRFDKLRLRDVPGAKGGWEADRAGRC